MTAPQSTRGSFASLAAALALILAAAALVVALTRDPKPAPRAAPTPTNGAANGVDASQLAPDSLTGAQIDESKLGKVPQSGRSDTAADARRLGGKGAAAFVPAERVAGGRLRRASAGETVTVLRKPPFSVAMRCARSRGSLNMVVTAKSAQTGSLMAIGGRSLQAFGGGTGRDFMTLTTSRAVWVGGSPFTLTAPSGASIAGMVSAGVKSFGADCAASVVALG